MVAKLNTFLINVYPERRARLKIHPLVKKLLEIWQIFKVVPLVVEY